MGGNRNKWNEENQYQSHSKFIHVLIEQKPSYSSQHIINLRTKELKNEKEK
jgi:hypothetical protein